ncbi:glycerate kinase [Aneurinibacillus tyrosinisolvens]|uniref:glycerate kinase n=1 Tax=Aneurinibacillus tyrosinisolvens TaxID=1443435 RepID=UPI00063F1FE6|nr:glycerate kinase [Aneurinibacillus tyrosinisolvens]
MNILIAPDSYKGSLSALEVASTIKDAFRQVIDDCVIEAVPMADGGEGTLEALIYSTKGKTMSVTVTDQLGDPILTEYGILGDNETVVIEIAKVVGLPLLPQERRNPLCATTYGIGEMMIHAIEQGYRKFIIGLGGSATNEGGIGLLQAVGVSFFDEKGSPVPPTAAYLEKIKTVDYGTIDPRIYDCQIVIASDVENELCGKKGASYVYGPQKGVREEQIDFYDSALYHYGTFIDEHLHTSYKSTPGSGAAGGLGFSLLTLGASIYSGAEMIAEKTRLLDKMANADWVITGEGKSDFQTLYGKVPHYIGRHANRLGVNALLLSGSLGENIDPVYNDFVSCHSITRGPGSLDDCMEKAKTYLYQTSVDIAKLMKACTYYRKPV